MHINLDIIDESTIATKSTVVHNILNGKKVIVAFSGGVDSVVVAKLAQEVATEVLLIMQIGSSVGIGEKEYAEQMAKLLKLPLQFIEYEEYLESEEYAKNPPNRCYYCKNLLHTKLEKIRKNLNYDIVIGGTNFSDLSGHRPGYAAVQEHNALSPLVNAKLTKAEIRHIAYNNNLPVWDKPATPCLASRIQTGIPVTPQRLNRIKQAEYTIKQRFNFRILRVRELSSTASVEVALHDLPIAREHWKEITEILKQVGYTSYSLNENGYKPFVP